MDINNNNTNNNSVKNKKKVMEITQIVRDVTIQIFALFDADNFLVLFPRIDLKGLGYVSQLFFVKQKTELITRTYNTSCSKRPGYQLL